MTIASFSIHRRVTVFMVTIGIMVLGFFSLNRLELKLLPDISYPSLTVRTEMDGAPPEEIENLISRPVEEALGIVNSLQQITSISRAGLSDVIVEFRWNTSMDKALMDVREKLDTIILPDGAERPRILRYNPETEPIMKIALTGENMIALHLFAEDEMKSGLETLPGVAAVRIMGGEEEEIRIEVDTRKLAGLGLSLADVSRRLTMENINLPGGILEEGESRFLVRTLNEFQTEEEIGDVVISSSDGTDIRLKDIASIVRETVENRTITRLNGHPGVMMDIYKEGDANIISVADAVRSRMGSPVVLPSDRGSFRQTLPESVDLEIISDQSTFIRAAIREVRSAAVVGSLLAIAVIYLFLRNVPNTIIIGLSIPISVVATFTLMYFRGISLNLMSLGGLALGIGMLVDNSIVVLENIFRIRETGQTAPDSARNGTEQVTTAVIASTLTTIAVFFPIVFVSGIAGQIFNDLAWTIAFSLLASLLVALSFIPMVASLGKVKRSDQEKSILIKRLWQESRLMFENQPTWKSYLLSLEYILSYGLWHSKRLIIEHLRTTSHKIQLRSSAFSLILTIVLFPFRLVYQSLSAALVFSGTLIVNGSWLLLFVPLVISRLIWSVFHWTINPLLQGFSWFFTWIQHSYRALLLQSLKYPLIGPWAAVCLLVAVTIFVVPRLGMDLIPGMAQGEFFIDIRLPVGSSLEQTQQKTGQIEEIVRSKTGVETVSAIIGSDMTSSVSLGAEQEHMATLQVILHDEYKDSAGEEEMIAILRESLTDVTGLRKLEFRKPSLLTIRTPLVVEVRGNDLDDLTNSAHHFADHLRKDPSFKDVTGTMESGYPEIQVVFDRTKLARLGMTPDEAANIMRNAIEGEIPTRFGLAGEELDIRVRADRITQMTPEDLQHLVINPGASIPILLNSVADVSRSVGPSEIRRINQRRVALIKMDTPLLDLLRATEKIDYLIAQQPAVPGVHFTITGQTDEMRESAFNLLIALCMAVFLVYLVMASQFESLLQPLIILISIPLGFLGALAGLQILQIPLSVVVFIGLIVLAGIAVNNAIILVDTTNNIFRRGANLHDAIIEAADQRFRPIMMTVMTTVLGLLPMAIASGPGEEIRKPLAMTVILGLTVSTFLTLLLIPTIYAIIHRHRIPLKSDIEA